MNKLVECPAELNNLIKDLENFICDNFIGKTENAKLLHFSLKELYDFKDKLLLALNKKQ